MGKSESYTSASAFPFKLLHTESVDKQGKIIPIHVQLVPTNACNLDCSFCSCSDRDKKKKLSLEEITNIVDICAEAGTKTMTITGGGEPLMHPQINGLINYCNKKNIEVGLVTNGILLDILEPRDNITWVRISSSDDRVPAYNPIKRAVEKNNQTDWAFSHVVTRNPNYKIINRLNSFANENNFTHIRLVSDLFDLDNVPSMDEIKKHIVGDDSKIIYQGRKDSTRGTKDCYISLLKPMISPEGIFPCCGVMYSLEGSRRDMVDKMKMGEISDLKRILEEQKHFDGSICSRCYYSEYNDALKQLKNKPEHINFV